MVFSTEGFLRKAALLPPVNHLKHLPADFGIITHDIFIYHAKLYAPGFADKMGLVGCLHCNCPELQTQDSSSLFICTF